MRKMMKTLCSSFALIVMLATGTMLLTPGLSGVGPALAQVQGGAGAPALVDINTASKSQLKALSGIGPVYSQKIVEGRPYSSKEELLKRGILPKGTYKKLQDKITVSPK